MIKHVRLVLQVETDEGEKFEGAIAPFVPGIRDIEDARVFADFAKDPLGLASSAVEEVLVFAAWSMRESAGNGEKDAIDVCLERVRLSLPLKLKKMSFDELYPHW